MDHKRKPFLRNSSHSIELTDPKLKFQRPWVSQKNHSFQKISQTSAQKNIGLTCSRFFSKTSEFLGSDAFFAIGRVYICRPILIRFSQHQTTYHFGCADDQDFAQHQRVVFLEEQDQGGEGGGELLGGVVGAGNMVQVEHQHHLLKRPTGLFRGEGGWLLVLR